MPHFNSVNFSGSSRTFSGLIYALAFACETSCNQLALHLKYTISPLTLIYSLDANVGLYKYSKSLNMSEIKQSK